jgi:hypothetical protein
MPYNTPDTVIDIIPNVIFLVRANADKFLDIRKRKTYLYPWKMLPSSTNYAELFIPVEI